MYRSQKLAIRYLSAAVIIFGVQICFGLLAALYYLDPQMLYGVFNFNMAKIFHIDTLIIWMLMGLMGSVYWFLPKELDCEPAGIWLAEVLFWVFCAAVAIVSLVWIFVQYGAADEFSLWFINQGRKYLEAPRWASIGIMMVLVTFSYNIVGACIRERRMTGITWVLCLDVIPLCGVYLDAFAQQTDLSLDLYWWWWIVHMWVESTWEVLIGCVMAWTLMSVAGTSRRVVETWLFIEVALVMGAGILGLGHHYFWIGTPSYWMAIGGFFSALEPLPLLGMVVHALYDAGAHRMKANNTPAFYWITAEAFGNFIGAGVWGFMMTLPQINLYSHGTQWTVSHAHFAFWGAYGCGLVAVFYLVKQQAGRIEHLGGSGWRWGFGLLNTGMIGMVMALLVSGMAQAFFGRAIGGSTLQAFVTMSETVWFVSGMWARMGFGVIFALGYIALVIDLVRAHKGAVGVVPRPRTSITEPA